MLFSDLFQKIRNDYDQSEITGLNDFQVFFKKYAESFDNKFKKNLTGDKAFIPDSNNIYFDSNRNLIYGFLIGGDTGIKKNVFTQDNPTETSKKIDVKEVTSLPFYFLLWMHPNSNHGLVMIQNYSNSSINSDFFSNLAFFFSNYQVSLDKANFVPKEKVDEFKKKSIVKEIAFIKRGMSKGAKRKFNPYLAEFDNLKLEIRLKNINEDQETFVKKFRTKAGKFFNLDLKELEMENPSDYDTIVYCEDENKKRASAYFTEELELFPIIELPVSIKKQGEDFPDLDKIHSYCLNELKKTRAELEIDVKDVD